jgi:hypothetical protein
MEHTSTRNIVNILRNTLRRLQDGSDFRRDDPAVIHLKRHLVRAIAELEFCRESQSEARSLVPEVGREIQDSAPITVLRMR